MIEEFAEIQTARDSKYQNVFYSRLETALKEMGHDDVSLTHKTEDGQMLSAYIPSQNIAILGA